MSAKSIRMVLPHGETDRSKTYAMPDPDYGYEVYARAYRAKYYGEGPMTDNELSYVLMLANAYLHLTTYELGQECCVGKLRDIWRARRAKCGKEL